MPLTPVEFDALTQILVKIYADVLVESRSLMAALQTLGEIQIHEIEAERSAWIGKYRHAVVADAMRLVEHYLDPIDPRRQQASPGRDPETPEA